ncbi:MAG: alanine--tRNA ligase [Lactobacillales bacterium]|jgi:alanyl-tRNA synthetase|nr:alanine--tRNA ligase [Lactobacillales bacterium]
MKQLSSAEIRQLFLDFFKSKGHSVEPSASLVPVEDPTLLWINSGVATLKKYFDGTIVPENPRITNSQKAIRTNDIENVGVTSRHHTLFEMLGNFSIGDYFKEEIIPWAWEFLTGENWLALDADKLYVTVYPEDEDAKRLWKEKVGLTPDRIIEIEDNFWDIGAGPCGPDSEIFFDRGVEFDPENVGIKLLAEDIENDRYIEIWNLVFSEFNHKEDGTYEPQPHKNIDTGLGLERVVSIVQNGRTNYDTDLFLPIIAEVEKLATVGPYDTKGEFKKSYQVIADHIRALSFAIGDGALPGNEGRGYVLRRLLRRAALHGQKLGINGVFLSTLVGTVGDIMKSYYPEILEKRAFIEQVVKSEEESFAKTIDEGVKLLNDLIDSGKTVSGSDLEGMRPELQYISGADAFKLSDTYGFPLELTEEIAEERNLGVDTIGFEREIEAQRNRARAARKTEGSMGEQSVVLMALDAESDFVGYSKSNVISTVAALVNADDSELIESGNKGETVKAVFAQTPFYAEMGGQVADLGHVYNEDGDLVGEITEVKKAPRGQFLHTIKLDSKIENGAEYKLTIDEALRNRVRKNHTATHLLHSALHQVIGSHANQAGSLVTATGLRFDFTHFSAVSKEELAQVEKLVNDAVFAGTSVDTIETDIENARNLGAMALFGEKYGNEVRVVKIGDTSIELCGGTHVNNTAEIGIFKIVSESGIGAGTRRIEAVTSQDAYELLTAKEAQVSEIAEIVKATQIKEVVNKVRSTVEELKTAQRENEKLSAKIANAQAGDIFNIVKTAESGATYIVAKVDVKDANTLRNLADQWKQKAASDVLVLGAVNDGKVSLLVAASDDAIARGIKAGDLIKQIAPIVGGGGGGRPDMAQAGGKNAADLPKALDAVGGFLK